MIKRITIISVMILGFIWLANCEQAPEVSITEPADNSTVSGIVEIKATATDNEEVTKVEFYVDEELKGTDETATDSEYSYTWDARDEIPGSKHTIQAKAYDVTDNVGESSVITVKIPYEGTIPYDETWYAADNPHIIVDDVFVEAVLTLEPGVIVKFGPGAGLYVGVDAKGALYADGTADLPIIFTSNFTPVGPGNWNGITFDRFTVSGVTVLNHCVVEYGGDNGYGNIYCHDASLAITNCTIRHSSTYGVYAERRIVAGFTDFSGNTITQNAEYPIRIDAEHIRTLGPGNILTGNAKDGILVGNGEVYTSGEWLNHGVPYIVTNELDIQHGSGPILTIASGNTLRFKAGTGILVGDWNPAALVADGSSGQITFTTDITPAISGSWNGITFCDGTIDGVTKLNNCVIEYGGGNGTGNIYCISASPTITNCSIRNSNKYGVFSSYGFTEFSDNTITENAGYPLGIDAEYVRTLGPGNNLTGNTKDGILVGWGYIYTSGEWLNHGVPYIITRSLTISYSDIPVLTIAPGNTLRFRADTWLLVGYQNQSALVADGSSGQITFTTDITPPEPGKWNGITFDGNTVDAITKLNNCVIEYGGGNGKGNIYCISASPTITNCAINYSSHWGIYLEGESSPTMYGNTFTGNQDGDIGP